MASEPQKIKLQCMCGKRYKVSIEKSGAEVTCAACGQVLTVPRPASVTGRTRRLVLQELGIDAEAAERKYKEELEKENSQTSDERVYECSKCQAKIKAQEMKGAYVRGELVCAGCRAGNLIEDRRLAEEAAARMGKSRRTRRKKGEALHSAAAAPSPVVKAVKYALPTFIGATCLIAVFGVAWWKAGGLGLGLAVGVALLVHNREVT